MQILVIGSQLREKNQYFGMRLIFSELISDKNIICMKGFISKESVRQSGEWRSDEGLTLETSASVYRPLSPCLISTFQRNIKTSGTPTIRNFNDLTLPLGKQSEVSLTWNNGAGFIIDNPFWTLCWPRFSIQLFSIWKQCPNFHIEKSFLLNFLPRRSICIFLQ